MKSNYALKYSFLFFGLLWPPLLSFTRALPSYFLPTYLRPTFIRHILPSLTLCPFSPIPFPISRPSDFTKSVRRPGIFLPSFPPFYPSPADSVVPFQRAPFRRIVHGTGRKRIDSIRCLYYRLNVDQGDLWRDQRLRWPSFLRHSWLQLFLYLYISRRSGPL